MRYIKYGFLAALAVVLIAVALANRSIVTLRLFPDELTEWTGIGASVSLPLFLVIFGGIVAGLLIGFVWEWLREMKFRGAASAAQRETQVLKREITHLRAGKASDGTRPGNAGGEDILALLENGTK